MRRLLFVSPRSSTVCAALAVLPAAAAARRPLKPRGISGARPPPLRRLRCLAAPEAAWTVLVYMGGDNNLEPLGHPRSRQGARRRRLERRRAGRRARRPRPPPRRRRRRVEGDARVFHVTKGMTGDGGERRRRLGRGQHGLAPDARRLRHLGPGGLPVPALRAHLLGPRLGLVARLHDAGRHEQRHSRHGRAASRPGDGGRRRHGRHGDLSRPDDRGPGGRSAGSPRRLRARRIPPATRAFYYARDPERAPGQARP